MSELPEALKMVQEFDVESLARSKEFGEHGFQESVAPARRLRDLYRSIDIAILDDLSVQMRRNLSSNLTTVLDTFSKIREFAPHDTNTNRQSLIQRVKDHYEECFLHAALPVVYSQLKAMDVQAIRKGVEEIASGLRERAEGMSREVEERNRQADALMKEVREAAAEQGVSQQAIYFRDEAVEHARLAGWWKFGTFLMASLIFAASIGSLFLHRIPELIPKTAFDSYQLIASKALIFAVLSYMLVLCARNFMSHKHNAVINKHRQNALMTFRVLAEAAADPKQKDVVLTHASACIFSPQETGYAKVAGVGSIGGKSVIELIQGATKSGE